MQKVLLLLFFFLLNGCSLNSLLALGEVDKSQVVKHTPYVKHYRAYFTRNNLQPIIRGKKYLYFYNAKQKDLSILLKRRNQYILYSLYHPNKKADILYTSSYRKIIIRLKHKGYHLASPSSIGAVSHVALRRYKGIKTILIEIKDYSRLQNVYKKAIKNYNARKVKHIRTSLPKRLISSYYKHYSKRAKTVHQQEQIQIIGRKLKLVSKASLKMTQKKPKPSKKTTLSKKIKKSQKIEKKVASPQIKQNIIPVEKEVEEVKVVEVLEEPKEIKKPYMYYLHNASYYELNSYLTSGEARNELTYNQYNNLKKRRSTLKEEQLLKNGSLEALIAAYKKNKDPRYKTKILSLMKKVQENK